MTRRQKRRILLASGNHLCSNPRVIKEADALSAAGFKVHVLGGSCQDILKQRDLKLVGNVAWSYRVAYDLTTSTAGRFWFKMQRKLGLLLWTKFGRANHWQISYGVGAIARAVRCFDADLTIAHAEAALPAAMNQLRRGKAVGIDMEDWFSEDLSSSARAGRPLGMLAAMESQLLARGQHSTCPSVVMAEALAVRYSCPRPVAVRNVFPTSERKSLDGFWKDRPDQAALAVNNVPVTARSEDAPLSIHWYSQTIGPGRGLEELFTAAEGLRGDFEIHLRGELGGGQNWLNEQLTPILKSRVHIHSPVENHELLSRIAEHDVGYAGERREPLSRNLTITNKFFQYLQGGLAVVASATSGQEEAAREATEAVCVYQPGNIRDLREALQNLINDRSRLRAMRAAAWAAGASLSWENEGPKLVNSVERIMDKNWESHQ